MGVRPPWCPPLVRMGDGIIGHLLCWEQHERDGSWHAWVSWVQASGDRHVHKIVCVQAQSLAPIEARTPMPTCHGASSATMATSGPPHGRIS